ncbi:ninein-like protein isoform X2 [Scyliorhinus canicula]|uniref:ninein-like protein isoform X2 n=1 Tax=Scyliorhinus canicula TaxID=7830 RepID=UPI0018F3ABC2|nr:ninein-like protein isoform X2 [Scyliorhinus canicula]
MDEAEQNKYVLQLKDVFDSCDTTGTGYLDSGELTELCQKLHLEAQIPLLLQTLLGSNHHGRVNFEDFKEGFVAVLSTSINLSISEDESSYFEPATPKEIEPKYIKGTKRYGRRSVPEFLDSEVETTDDLEEPLHFKAAKDEMFLQSANRSHLRHSASLESVESLKSDEEMEHHKEPLHETFEAPGRLSKWNPNDFDSPRRFSTPCPEATESHVQAIWDELGVGKNGYLNTEELATVCDNIGLKDLENKEVAELFRKLDKDGDGKVNLSEFLVGLFRHEPVTSFPSTLYKQKYRRALYQTFHENRWRTSTPSLVSKTVGAQLFSGLDDGTGYASPEQIIDMWQEDGITNSQEILEALAFDVEEKVNLADLTKALENELLASKTGIHQAALACYKNEINYLQGQIQQLHKERDKVKVDLDRAEKRNVQLAKDVDDQHSAMESLNETKLKHLDQGYKEKMTAVKLELDREQELITQQVNTQRAELEHEIDSLRSEEIHFQEKLKLTMKENSRLQKELVETVEKLTESEKLVSRLQKDLDYVLKEKFGTLDHPSLEIFGQEQRFSELIMQYEQQCRELRDRNDELQTEMQVLHKQLHHRNHHYAGNKKNSIYRGTDSSIIRCESVPDKVPPEGECANVSIKAEIAMEQLRKQHVQELHDLRIQLQTKVNYYEREIELMKRNFEKERKYVEQSFKIEISELEDQRMAREQEMERLQGVVNELCVQQQQGEATQEEAITALLKKHETVKVNLQEELRKEQMENLKYKMEELKKGGELNKMFEAWAKTKLVFQMQEQEKRFEWEKTEQQRAFAKEKSELEQRLTKEKLQMEKELKLQHQKELQQLRKATQDESNLRFSLLEVDHVALTQKYQSDKAELIQRYDLKIEELLRQQSQMKIQWESRVQEICNEAKKEKLALQEKMHEEQAEICRTFAIEREEMETKYKEQIHSLGSESESLNVQIKELKHVINAGDLTHQDEKLTGDNSCLYRDIHAHPSTNEEFSALLKKKEEEIFGWQQQKDEMEIKLRYESEMLSEENSSLKRKMTKFHQEFQDVEGKVDEQRKQVEQLKNERECRQREFEELQKRNKQYVAEIAQLNSKNLQLSDQNSQFSAKVDANQNSIRLLHTRLAELSQQKDEVVCVTRQLQETSSRLEKEHLQQQSAWEREKQLMEQELRETKEKLLDLDSLAKEASALRTEKQSLSQPLHEAKIKVKNLELDLERAHSELDHLKREIRGQQQENLSLAQEMGSITKSLQEAKDRISQMHILETKLESMKQECQTLQGTQVRLEADLMESQEQLLEANTKLALSQSQHLQEVQQLKEQVCNAVPKNQLAQLQLELTEEQQKVQQLQEQLNAQNQEANKLMCEQQEEYKRLLKRMEERMEEVEQKLKSVRIMLQDKMNQLKEQFTKNAKSDLMVKDLYVENAQLMKALQITEQRQKGAERKNFLLDEKIAALNRVLRKIAPTSLS